MNKPGPGTSDGVGVSRPIFISYATADRRQARAICTAIERRGIKCWISTRDVAPGENYQEAIVRALRGSRAMVLVFSGAANNSDEIKKELSLASRYHVPLMALRIEDVEPSDAFAYELSTRQWVDAFTGWDKSIDTVVRHVRQLAGNEDKEASKPVRAAPPVRARAHRLRIGAIVLATVFSASGMGWWLLRPLHGAPHSMTVRLTGFQRLSADLPGTLPDAVRDEIIAAFGDQGVVGASTASSPSTGSSPAYALGGTLRRDGDAVRVITRLTNERSGATLWSESEDYDLGQLSRVPRQIAVRAGNMARCGLFAASTYPKALPDGALADYMQYCATTVVSGSEPEKGLDFARRVVAAVPDFSWGWSAVAFATAQILSSTDREQDRQELRSSGIAAAERALSIDPRNSEAFAQKSMLMDPTDLVAQEKLLKRALAARPLDCGCEHLTYGTMLQNVGRYRDSIAELRRATDMLALDYNSQFTLADALAAVGRLDDAKPHFRAAADLSPDPDFAGFASVIEATETGDYSAAIRAFGDPRLKVSSKRRPAMLAALRAMASGDAEAKAQAIKALDALPDDQKNFVVAKLLSVLGAPHDALLIFLAGIGKRYDWPSLLWYPSMRRVLDDPAFPRVAGRLGLMNYWRSTHIKPDVCSDNKPPRFCDSV